MPRTSLLWHLFAGWCSLVAGVLVCCYWLASVRLADLADAAQRHRLEEVARTVLDGVPAGETPADDAFVERARSEGAATSGARSGGRLADFLDGDDRGNRSVEDGTSTADAQVNVAEGVDADLLERLTQRPS